MAQQQGGMSMSEWVNKELYEGLDKGGVKYIKENLIIVIWIS